MCACAIDAHDVTGHEFFCTNNDRFHRSDKLGCKHEVTTTTSQDPLLVGGYV